MMLSSIHALELQANQLQMNLLSQMSFPMGPAPMRECSPKMFGQGLSSQFPKLDLVSLACGQSAPHVYGQDSQASLLLPAFNKENSTSPLSSLRLSSSHSSSAAATMLADFLSSSQPIVKPKAVPVIQTPRPSSLSDTLVPLDADQLKQTTLPGKPFHDSSHTHKPLVNNDDADTEAEDGQSPEEDMVDGEADVTIFPRRKQGQDKLGRNRPAIKITRPVLEQLFDIPQRQACKRLGICATVMKRVCRKLGVHKWPYKESMARKQGHMLNRIMSQSQ